MPSRNRGSGPELSKTYSRCRLGGRTFPAIRTVDWHEEIRISERFISQSDSNVKQHILSLFAQARRNFLVRAEALEECSMLR
jgi:hypothetical protein